MKIGKTISLLRHNAGISQGELAETIGISRVYVSELERDIKSPTLNVFWRLASAFKMSPSKLMAKIENDNVRRKMQ